MVSLNNLSQAVFGTAIAAVCVGMELFYERLVAGLDLAAGFVAVEVEGGEGAPFEIAQRPPLGLVLRLGAGRFAAEDAERIGKCRRPGEARVAGRAGLRSVTPMDQVGRWPVAAERW